MKYGIERCVDDVLNELWKPIPMTPVEAPGGSEAVARFRASDHPMRHWLKLRAYEVPQIETTDGWYEVTPPTDRLSTYKVRRVLVVKGRIFEAKLDAEHGRLWSHRGAELARAGWNVRLLLEDEP